jgi:hypothetical protein
MVIATGVAALLYLPWLPGLKGDIDSPTTEILSAFSPYTFDLVKVTVGHWTIGFPFAGPERGLTDLPGTPGLLLLLASLAVAGYGLVSMRSRLGEWSSVHRRGVLLVVLLGLATPVGSTLQSAVGANVFSTRSLAASWPYLALAVSALLTVGRPAVRLTAAARAVVGLGLGAAGMLGADIQRPQYQAMARFVDEHPGGVVIDGAAFTPGPLSNFDVEGSMPAAAVLRLNVPVQMTTPFGVGETLPDPLAVAQQAVAAADGGPISVLTPIPRSARADEVIAELGAEGYALTDSKQTDGLIELEALVFEPAGTS